MVLEVNESNFESEVVKSSKPVVVDFWAAWCGPCRMLAPILDELSYEMDDQLKFVKVNVDENRELAYEFGIRGIPSLVVLYKGAEVERLVGVKPKESLKSELESILDKLRG